MIRVALGMALVVATAATASAQEYRQVETIDGRSIIAEVVASEATGFLLRVPTGLWRLPYTDLADMQNSTEAAYLGQPDWPVWILAEPATRAGFVSAYRAVEGVAVIGSDDTRFAPERIAQAATCNLDIVCAMDVFADSPPVYVVRATLNGGEAVFETAMAGSEFTNVVRANRTDTTAVGNAVYDSLGLVPPDGVVVQLADVEPSEPRDPVADVPDPVQPPPPEPDPVDTNPVGTREDDITVTPPPPSRTAWTRQRVLRSSFIPVPGYTAFAQGDSAGGALAVAAVVPLTAAWVGTSGATAQSTGEHVALSVGGFYLATVAANQVLGLRSHRRAMAAAVVPSDNGGVVFTLAGSR